MPGTTNQSSRVAQKQQRQTVDDDADEEVAEAETEGRFVPSPTSIDQLAVVKDTPPGCSPLRAVFVVSFAVAQ